MNPATWKTIKETFSSALELPLPERESLLSNSSAEIRREVERLLASYKEAQAFISTPILVEKGLHQKPAEENLVGKQIDQYVILRKLGEGGMGTVFLAEHSGQGFSQRVALKLIKRGMDTNAVLGRFLLERQILAGLEHPNIARLYGGGSTADGLPYFVMEYVEGESIKNFCQHQRFDLNDRLILFTKVCEAISYAHQQLIIHRDIKPSNIIVTAAGEPKLLDFGIAKLLLPDSRSAERTATQFHVMTPDYASPEQLTGKMTTTATDVYSLGVVLYEMLTGRRPFDFKGKTLVEISDALRTQRPLRPSDCLIDTAPDGDAGTTIVGHAADTASGHKSRGSQTSARGLKGDLDNIVLQAIRREPERRYQSVVELNEDIKRYLAGLPVKATADTVRYRAGKFIQRHRIGVSVTVCFILLLLIATAITGRQYLVARAERAKSEQRLNDLRGVAKSLLTDTNAALKKLPEGLEIRKSIVEKSLAVLDNLAADESNDPRFLNELADAYDEIANIRHWQFHQSRLALSDLNKALQLRRRAIALAPTLENRKKLSITLPNMALVYGARADREAVLRTWQDQQQNDLRIIELDQVDPQTYLSVSIHAEELATVLEQLGRAEESAAQLKLSFAWIEKAISLQQAAPTSIDGQLGLVWFLMQKAELLHRWHRLDDALSVYQEAADLAVKTYHADNTKMFAFNHASRTHRYMADIYAEKGDWQKYLECSQFSVNWINENRDNRNLWGGPGLPPNTAYYSMRVGIGLNKLGHRSEAIAKFEDGMKQFHQQLYSHPNHGEDLLYAFETIEPASAFYLETNQDEKAVGIWDEYIRLAEPFVANNPDDTTSLGLLSYAIERKGDTLAKYQKAREAFDQTDNSKLRAALKTYEESSQRRQRILQLDPTNQSYAEAEKALEQKISLLSARRKTG